MLNHKIAAYMPIALQVAQLEPGETHHYSFKVTETERQLIGYKPKAQFQFICHLTDRRLILEPNPIAPNWLADTALSQICDMGQCSPDQPFFQIAYSAIQRLEIAKFFGVGTYAKINFHAASEAIILSASLPQSESKKGDRSEDFVILGSGLLEIFNLMNRSDQASPAIDLTAANRFKQIITTSELPVLVSFSAPSCQPCQMQTPVIHQMVAQHENKVHWVKVNVEQHFNLAIQYGIDCFPTLLIFKAGKVVEQIVGTVPNAVLDRVLNQHLK